MIIHVFSYRRREVSIAISRDCWACRYFLVMGRSLPLTMPGEALPHASAKYAAEKITSPQKEGEAKMSIELCLRVP